jgi:hypothetical protein
MWYERDVRVVLVIAAGAACGGGGDGRRRAETAIEREVRAAVTGAIGEPVTAIACTATACRVTAGASTVDVPIAVRADGSATAWRIDGSIVGAAKLEAHVGALLGELAIAGRADCGPRVIVARPGDRIACALTPDGGRAFAMLRDDGTVDVELALGADVAGHRSRDLDDGELDALSRGLDRDDAFAAEDEAAPPGSDAGGP